MYCPCRKMPSPINVLSVSHSSPTFSQEKILYKDCCKPFHNGKSVDSPEQLMRSRYSAHALKLVNYIVDTYHSSCQAKDFYLEIVDSVNGDWLGLKIIDAPVVDEQAKDPEGFVEFKAYFKDGTHTQSMHERSRFVKEGGRWKYIDGDVS